MNTYDKLNEVEDILVKDKIKHLKRNRVKRLWIKFFKLLNTPKNENN
jgi:hypothetical protein